MASIREKKGFLRNTNVGRNVTQLYVWYVDTSIEKKSGMGNKLKPSCDAKKGSQGYDNITGYVYNLLVVNGIVEHLAYVECDYVQ